MDFGTYKSNVKLGTPADQTSNIRISNPGADALAREQAKTGAILLSGIDRLRAEVQTGRVMQANNEYNKELMDLTNELRQNKEQDALNTVEQFDEREQKIRSRIQKKYGAYLYGDAGRKYNEMQLRDYNSRRQSMINYQIDEAEKFNDTTLKNGLMDVSNLATADYMNPENVEGAMNKAAHLVALRYEHYGEEKIKQMTRVAQGQIAQQIIDRAYATGDTDAAETYIERYGQYMDPGALTRYSKAVYQNRLRTITRDTAESLVGRYGNNIAALRDAIYNRGEGGSGYDGNKAVAWMKRMAADGRNWGVNTCTKGVNAALEAGGGLPGNTWAPTNWDDAKKAGMAFKDRSQLRTGDIVYWWKPGSDKDADDTSHVGIYDAETGKVYQSGTSGFKAIDLDTYSVTGFARPQGRGMTRDQQDALYDACVRKINQDKAIRNQQIDAAYDDLDKRFMAMHDAKNMNYEDYMAIANQFTDPEMRRKANSAATYWWNEAVKMSKRTQRTMGPAEMASVTNMIWNGEFDSKSDMEAFMQSPDHRFSVEQINKAKGLWKDRLNGTGIFKIHNFNALVNAAIEKTGDTQKDKSYKIWLEQFGIDFINSYRKLNHGEDPTTQELQEALSKEYTEKKLILNSPDGQTVSFKPIDLTPKNIVSVDNAVYYNENDKKRENPISMPGMLMVTYRDEDRQGRSAKVYMPIRQFRQEIGQLPGIKNEWLGNIGQNNYDTGNGAD